MTTSWWKEERGRRLFIDYNQNARDRTFAAAYSVRATPIATVSTPLTWEELAGADPDDYTMATVPALVAERGDPMAGLDSVAQSIDPLLAMVAADGTGVSVTFLPAELPEDAGRAKRVQPSRDTDRKNRDSNSPRATTRTPTTGHWAGILIAISGETPGPVHFVPGRI